LARCFQPIGTAPLIRLPIKPPFPRLFTKSPILMPGHYRSPSSSLSRLRSEACNAQMTLPARLFSSKAHDPLSIGLSDETPLPPPKHLGASKAEGLYKTNSVRSTHRRRTTPIYYLSTKLLLLISPSFFTGHSESVFLEGGCAGIQSSFFSARMKGERPSRRVPVIPSRAVSVLSPSSCAVIRHRGKDVDSPSWSASWRGRAFSRTDLVKRQKPFFGLSARR